MTPVPVFTDVTFDRYPYIAYHTGLDITAPIGTRVSVPADGTVIQAGMGGNFSGYGRVVIVDHGNGYQTYYGHLSRGTVMPGQLVRQGDIVGEVGMTGRRDLAPEKRQAIADLLREPLAQAGG